MPITTEASQHHWNSGMYSSSMVNVYGEEEANIDETSNQLPSCQLVGINTDHTLNTNTTIASNQSPIHRINLYFQFLEQETPSTFTLNEPTSNNMHGIGMNMYYHVPHPPRRTHAQYPPHRFHVMPHNHHNNPRQTLIQQHVNMQYGTTHGTIHLHQVSPPQDEHYTAPGTMRLLVIIKFD
jgi:hypothetical protein